MPRPKKQPTAAAETTTRATATKPATKTKRNTTAQPQEAQTIQQPQQIQTINTEPLQPPQPRYTSPLAAADIQPLTPEQLAQTAAAEGWQKNNAYGAVRVKTLTQQQIFAQSIRLKQAARKHNYNLESLLAGPQELMIEALDRFDLFCYETNLQPLEHLLAVWLNCSIGELDAVKTTANINGNAKLIVDHQAFAVSVISQMALQSDKPPVFSMYYLKAVHRMLDVGEQQNGINVNICQNSVNARFSIDKGALQNNAQLFTLAGSDEE